MPSLKEAQPVVAGSANCLVVDDEPGVRRSLIRMLQAQGFTCFEASSGIEALDVLDRVGDVQLIVSDMRMPELDGIGLLEAVQRDFPETSVILLSGMSETTTAVDCLHRGAADFLLKPISMNELQARVARVLEKRALVLENRYYQENLERRVQEQAQRIQELFLQGVQMLARALEAKDAYTRGHSIRVSRYAVGTARCLGFCEGSVDSIRLGGELHDIGKIGTREAVLHKPGSLTAEEFRQISEHPILGERMLSPLARESAGGAPDRALPPRAIGRPRLSGRPAGREDPDGGADRGGGRYLRRDHDPASVPRLPLARGSGGRAAPGGRDAARSRGGRGLRRRLPQSGDLAAVGLSPTGLRAASGRSTAPPPRRRRKPAPRPARSPLATASPPAPPRAH